MAVLRPLHARLHRWAVGHGHAIRIDMLIGKSVGILHTTQELTNTLCMTDRTIFVAHQKAS